MNLVDILVGLAVLFFGRKLFWVFVGGVGFLLGVTLAGRLLMVAPGWQVLVSGLVLGALGALTAIVFERAAVAVAGFLVGAAIGMGVMDMMAFRPDPLIWSVSWLVAGVFGAMLVTALFDWALIVLSSVVGAGLVVNAITMTRPNASALFALLLVIGIVVQATRWERGPRAIDRH